MESRILFSTEGNRYLVRAKICLGLIAFRETLEDTRILRKGFDFNYLQNNERRSIISKYFAIGNADRLWAKNMEHFWRMNKFLDMYVNPVYIFVIIFDHKIENF